MYMYIVSRIFFVLVISCSVTLTLQTEIKCDAGSYYDPAIGRCDTCNVICDLAEIQGTVEQCKLRCPDFYISTKITITEKTKDDDATNKQRHSSASSEETRLSETVFLLIVALCVVTMTLSAVIIILIAWKIRGDTSYKHEMRRIRTSYAAPIYKKSQLRIMNGDKTAGNILLSGEEFDV